MFTCDAEESGALFGSFPHWPNRRFWLNAVAEGETSRGLRSRQCPSSATSYCLILLDLWIIGVPTWGALCDPRQLSLTALQLTDDAGPIHEWFAGVGANYAEQQGLSVHLSSARRRIWCRRSPASAGSPWDPISQRIADRPWERVDRNVTAKRQSRYASGL